MTPAPLFLAAACLILGSSCASPPKLFSVDPDRRGFELPARPVVLFFVDGLRADVLEELAETGKLPRLQRLLFDRATRVRSAVACVPSVTYANSVSMLTGFWPSRHGIGSNACFDRRLLRTRNYEAKRELANSDETRATLFEMLPDELTAGVALPFERGIKLRRAKSAETGGARFGIAWVLGRKKAADRRLSEQLYEIADQVRTIGEWPVFVAVHLPGVDNIGHEHGSDGAEYREAVENLDSVIGEVLEAFERGGMLDELTIVLTSDHGHHSAPHSLALDEHLAAVLGMPVLVALENDGDAPFLERWQRYTPAQAIVIPNGVREASVHLRVAETWNERPTVEEILTFPTVHAVAAGSRLPERLLQSNAIHLVAVRVGEDAVRVYGREGSSEIRRTGGPHEASFTYVILGGVDPLGYATDERLRGWMQAPHTSLEWLTATADLRHPDLVPQLLLAFDDPRGGDLKVFAAPGWDFSTDYLGGHGGLEREELIIPLYFAGPGIRAGHELPAARLVDLAPTLLELFGVEFAGEGPFDGVSILEQLR